MTSLSATNRVMAAPRRGFTLVEVLVVIGIIVLLMGILIPMVNRAYTNAARTRSVADLAMLSTALEAYNHDFNSYPAVDETDATLVGTSLNGPDPSNKPTPPPGPNSGAQYPGAVVLCWALAAPGTAQQDGNDGLGFKTRTQGQVWGPYVEAGRVKFANDYTVGSEPNFYFADRYGHPILYFPAHKSTDPAQKYVGNWLPSSGGTPPYYNIHDGLNNSFAWINETTPANAIARMSIVLGGNATGDLKDGSGAAVTPVTRAPYILWSAGPDELFGIDVKSANLDVEKQQVPSCDDAIFYRQ